MEIGNSGISAQKMRRPYRAPEVQVILSHVDTANPATKGPLSDPPESPLYGMQAS